MNHSNIDCINNLRIDRREFSRLQLSNRVDIIEQVAMLFKVLAYHSKSKVVGYDFNRLM